MRTNDDFNRNLVYILSAPEMEGQPKDSQGSTQQTITSRTFPTVEHRAQSQETYSKSTFAATMDK